MVVNLATSIADGLCFCAICICASIAFFADTNGIIAFRIGKVATGLAIGISVASWVTGFAVVAFLGSGVAYLHSLGVDLADFLAGIFIGPLSLVGEDAGAVAPVAVVSLAVLGLESSWAGELVWFSGFVATALEFGLSSILVVQGSALAPSAEDIGVSGCDT